MTDADRALALDPQTCQAYQALCSFCSWALYADPAEQSLHDMVRDRQLFKEPPFSQVAMQASASFASVLDEAATSQQAFDELFSCVRRDRTYLFLMAGMSKVSPYESVWCTDDATLFGPQTLEVREMYREAGLAFDRAASEPDDHIGLEFSFAAHLLGKAALGDARALPLLRGFLREHLLAFGPACLERIGQRAQSDYFRAVASIASAVLCRLACDLGAQPVQAC